MKIEIKNYRTCGAGMEYDAFSYTLWLDGKRAAEISDDGNGGELNVVFLPRAAGRDRSPKAQAFHDAFVSHVEAVFASDAVSAETRELYDGRGPAAEAGADPEILADRARYAARLRIQGMMEHVLSQALDTFEEERDYKRWCRTKVCFRLRGDKPGEWRIVKAKDSPELRAWIAKEYGDRVEEILNDRF